MSFFDIESQNPHTPKRDTSDSADLGDSPDSLIIALARQLKILQRECSKLGTKKDSLEVRHDIETGIIPYCNSIRDKIDEQTWSSSEQILEGSKLYNDFQMLKNELQQSERDYTDKKLRNIIRKPRNEPNSFSKAVRRDPESHYVSIQVNEQTPLLFEDVQDSSLSRSPNQQQQYSQLQEDSVDQDELDFNTIIQRERSQQINKIHSAVQEVNAIFRQLGTLVNEQGEQVDTIDGNVDQLSSNMQKANEQLNKADEHQRKRNRCGLMTLVIMIIVVLVIVLAVLS